jgi:hypothetical protein
MMMWDDTMAAKDDDAEGNNKANNVEDDNERTATLMPFSLLILPALTQLHLLRHRPSTLRDYLSFGVLMAKGERNRGDET